MSYPIIDSKDFYNVLERKEFYALKVFEEDFRETVDDTDNYLKIHSHQLFVRNFMNPDTPYRTLHLEHATGTGKTLAAIVVAQEFLAAYKKIYVDMTTKITPGKRAPMELDRVTPSIIVLGFNSPKIAFIRELLNHPELGFVSYAERDELTARHVTAHATGMPEDVKFAREYYSMLKKRITNKARGGFYKFYGYDEFVNRLFSSNTVKLTDIEVDAASRIKAGTATSLEEVFSEYIAKGIITVNTTLLTMCNNSLLIADEVHNTYNTNMKNNRGVAIQYVLDTVPTTRFLSLSATPINNSPTEVIDMLNLHMPPHNKLTKRAFFSGRRTLLPGKLEELGRLSAGKISFLQDVNIKYFPRREFVGRPMILPINIENMSAGTEIPYLKFIECPMSPIHQRTLVAYLESSRGGATFAPADKTDAEDIEDDDVPHSVIPTDGYGIYDGVLPGPNVNADGLPIGVFRSSDFRVKRVNADPDWKTRAGINTKKQGLSTLITGEFLERKNIAAYSTKSAMLLDILEEIVGTGQKVMIYHNQVRMFGVLFIQELLKANGYIDEYSEPTDATRCVICGRRLEAHSAMKPQKSNATKHTFKPARFVVAHSDVDKPTMNRSLSKYTAATNLHGADYMILVGSKIIKESYDFKDIQQLIIMSAPVNIPTLIQVFGRGIRKFSHINLPLGQRQVNIRLMVSTINDKEPTGGLEIAPEARRYAEKIADYVVIQKIEREFNRNAVDASIHRDIIMPPELQAKYFPSCVQSDTPSGTPITLDPACIANTAPLADLGPLYFEPLHIIKKLAPRQTSEMSGPATTFTAYKRSAEEIKQIIFLIKRLFTARPVWNYADLFARVRAGGAIDGTRPGLEMNPALFSEPNFIIALHTLVIPAIEIEGTARNVSNLEKMLDPHIRHIYINATEYKIEQVGPYYIRFPIENRRPMIDVETYMRPSVRPCDVVVSLAAYAGSTSGVKFKAHLDDFVRRCEDTPPTFYLDSYSEPVQKLILEAVIESMMKDAAPKESLLAYKALLTMMNSLGMLIYSHEISRYKDVVKQFGGKLPQAPRDVPLAYVNTKSVRCLGTHGWFEVSKVSLNRQMVYKEQGVVIGYFESIGGDMKFKLREPAGVIKDAAGRDTRAVRKGIVCNTKTKHELVRVATGLGITLSKTDKADARIRGLCEAIKERLIMLESKERQKDSRWKYLYGWWDDPVNLTN